MKIGLFYFSHDGITSLYTGVGTVSRDTCYALSAISDKLLKNGVKLDVHLGTIRYSGNFHGYSESVKKEILNINRSYKSNLFEVENGSDGQFSYGNINNWKIASLNASKIIDQKSKLYDYSIAIYNDTPFAQTGINIKSKNVVGLWIPASTAKIHTSFKIKKDDGSYDKFMKERIKWEAEVISHANESSNYYVGYIGEFFKKHLKDKYGTKSKSLLKTTVGLYFPRLDSYKNSSSNIQEYLKGRKIDTSAPLLLSFARTENYKGLDLTLKLGGVLKIRHGFNTLIFTVPYSMNDPYIDFLEKIKQKYNPTAQITYGHDFLTPHYLMQLNQIKIVAVLSRQEPAGLVPSEAAYYNNPTTIVLSSDRDGLRERVIDGYSGFVTKIDSIDTIISAAENVLRLNETDRIRLAENGFNKVTEEYDIVKNVDLTISELINKFI